MIARASYALHRWVVGPQCSHILLWPLQPQPTNGPSRANQQTTHQKSCTHTTNNRDHSIGYEWYGVTARTDGGAVTSTCLGEPSNTGQSPPREIPWLGTHRRYGIALRTAPSQAYGYTRKSHYSTNTIERIAGYQWFYKWCYPKNNLTWPKRILSYDMILRNRWFEDPLMLAVKGGHFSSVNALVVNARLKYFS